MPNTDTPADTHTVSLDRLETSQRNPASITPPPAGAETLHDTPHALAETTQESLQALLTEKAKRIINTYTASEEKARAVYSPETMQRVQYDVTLGIQQLVERDPYYADFLNMHEDWEDALKEVITPYLDSIQGHIQDNPMAIPTCYGPDYITDKLVERLGITPHPVVHDPDWHLKEPSAHKGTIAV